MKGNWTVKFSKVTVFFVSMITVLGILLTVAQEEKIQASTNDFSINTRGVLTGYNGVGGDIEIPTGVRTIGKDALKGNTLINSVKIPSTVTEIENSAFDSCSSLKTISFESGINKIGDYAFFGCSSLTKVEFPKSLTSVGFCAFANCDKLNGIMLGNELSEISSYAFGYTYNYDYTQRPNFVIMGEKNSSAQTYAEKYGLTFLAKGDITAKINKVTNAKKGKATVCWIRNENTTGYEIQYATNKNFSKAKTVTAKTSQSSKTISSMKKGSTYYFRVRGYRTIAGKKYYSSWSATKSVKIKK